MAVKRKSQSGNNQQQNKAGDDGLFDMLNPNNLMNNAQKVINSAVNVLEEEIAAGILAAKRIEKKVIDVDEIRDDSQNLMNRIRRDTHEALDIFLDTLAVLSKQIGTLTERVTKENGQSAFAMGSAGGQSSPSGSASAAGGGSVRSADSTKNPSATSTGKPAGARDAAPSSAPPSTNNAQENTPSVQVIQQNEPAVPGQPISFSFLISDSAITAPVDVVFQKADFFGPGSQKISAKHIQIMPPSIVLHPGEEKEITVRLQLPQNCSIGHYNAILIIPQMPSVKIILSFHIQ